jgi:hypothetical protein
MREKKIKTLWKQMKICKSKKLPAALSVQHCNKCSDAQTETDTDTLYLLTLARTIYRVGGFFYVSFQYINWGVGDWGMLFNL